MTQIPSITQALAFAKQLLDESRSGEILLAHVLKQSRAYLYTWPLKMLTDSEWVLFQDLIKQRVQGVPIAYLLEEKEFYSLPFKVTTDTLIPRPETELLVDKALELMPAETACKVLELGTGSGAIAVTLAALRPLWQVTAVDISNAALAVAQHNARAQQLTTITFIESDWFSAISGQTFNLIISNPPYLAADDEHLQQGDVRFEPTLALIANKGLACLETIISQAPGYLLPEGWLLVEHGHRQKDSVQNLFHQAQFSGVTTLNDLADLPRITLGQKIC